MRTQKIIVPTDFSNNAQDAVDYALKIFNNRFSHIVLLNTYYLPYADAGVSVSLDDITAENANKLFKKEVKRVHHTFPKLKATVETRFEIGDVVDVVANLEKKESIYAIVMGTKGASGLTEILVGSRTAAMVRKVNCPVFVIPQNVPFKVPRNILFATDLDVFPSNADVNFIVDLAKKFKSTLSIVHVSKKREEDSIHQEFIKQELDYDFISIPHTFDEVTGEKVVSSLESYIKGYPVDLVIMLSEKGNLFHRVFHKSITKKIALHTKTPLLVMNK